MLRYAKAAAGALVAGLLVLKSAVGDDTITAAEWIDAGIQFVVGLGVIWAVPNAPPYDARHD